MRMPDSPAGGRRGPVALPLLAALATAAVLATVLVVVVTGPSGRADGRGEPDRAALSGSPPAPGGADPADGVDAADGAGIVDLDAGAPDAPAVEACLSTEAGAGFAEGPAEVALRYGVVQRTAAGTAPTLVLENADGALLLCDAAGGDRPAQAPPPRPTPGEPVVLLGGGRGDLACAGDTLTGHTSSTWLAVSDDVSTVQQRYVVGGTPGPWFRTSPRAGVAHLQTWLEGPVPAGTPVALEHQVLDASGTAVAQRTLPTQPTPVAGCTGGGAQIG